MTRKQIAAANWKMNLTWEQASSLLQELKSGKQALKEHQQVVLAVPFPYLVPSLQAVEGVSQYAIAAQNMYGKKSGAFTGEVSAEMISSIGIRYVILGHSERREYFGETDAQLAGKIDLALEYGLTPIFCCGEPLPVREEERQNEYVALQLRESLFHLDGEQVSRIVIAYEPVWAIGTGKTATSQQAQDMQAYLRGVLSEQYGEDVAKSIPILYGGSVKGSNAKEIFSMPDVDGGLVGGASLKGEEFIQIIQALK